MENAVNALKMGAAILVFSIALSIIFMLFTRVNEASQAVFESVDQDRYMDEETMSMYAKADSNRIVGVETIIPMLNNYEKEGNCIIILDENEQILSFKYPKYRNNGQPTEYYGSGEIQYQDDIAIFSTFDIYFDNIIFKIAETKGDVKSKFSELISYNKVMPDELTRKLKYYPNVNNKIIENKRKYFIDNVLLDKYKDSKFEEIFWEDIYNSGRRVVDEYTGEIVESIDTRTTTYIVYKCKNK